VDAKEILNEWIKKAESPGITILKKFANTLAGHAFGILRAYFSRRLSAIKKARWKGHEPCMHGLLK
jgi:hypothetical protein